jgi:hypothetical protein
MQPAQTGGDRDQDLGHGRRVHRKLGACQQRVELMGADGDRYQRVSTRVVMIESACEPFACVDGQTCCRTRSRCNPRGSGVA